MNRVLVLFGLLVVPMATAHAFDPWIYGFNQRPFGLQSETLVPTPPYFALHPPVYYGERYSRPYGISPFPASPNVGIPESYKANVRSSSVAPIQLNSFCEGCNVGKTQIQPVETVEALQAGVIQINPYAEPSASQRFAAAKSGH